MDEFKRRLLDAVQNGSWIASVARQDRKILDVDYYNYNTLIDNNGAGIASGATGQGTIQIQSDSDFAIAYMSGVSVVNNTVGNSPYATIQITDTGTGKTFFNAPTLFGLVMGSNGLPFYLPAPRVVAPNTNLQFAINNINSAGNASFYVNLLGARIFYAS
jgi:hypothetical protein